VPYAAASLSRSLSSLAASASLSTPSVNFSQTWQSSTSSYPPTISAQFSSIGSQPQQPVFYGSDLSVPIGIALGLLVSVPLVILRFRRRA
jgi:hypothetical protein